MCQARQPAPYCKATVMVISPVQVLKGAHAPGSAITSLAFSRGGFTLLSRSEDETLKVRRSREARCDAIAHEFSSQGRSESALHVSSVIL